VAIELRLVTGEVVSSDTSQPLDSDAYVGKIAAGKLVCADGEHATAYELPATPGIRWSADGVTFAPENTALVWGEVTSVAGDVFCMFTVSVGPAAGVYCFLPQTAVAYDTSEMNLGYTGIAPAAAPVAVLLGLVADLAAPVLVPTGVAIGAINSIVAELTASGPALGGAEIVVALSLLADLGPGEQPALGGGEIDVVSSLLANLGVIGTAAPAAEPMDVVLATVPAQVTGLTLTPYATSIGCAWTANSPAPDYYHVQYKETSSGTWLDWDNGTPDDPTTNACTITGLTLGVSYDVRVRAHNSLGNGDYSTTTTTTTVSYLADGTYYICADGTISTSAPTAGAVTMATEDTESSGWSNGLDATIGDGGGNTTTRDSLVTLSTVTTDGGETSVGFTPYPDTLFLTEPHNPYLAYLPTNYVFAASKSVVIKVWWHDEMTDYEDGWYGHELQLLVGTGKTQMVVS